MSRQLFNRTINVNGIDIFYREAGDRKNPSLLLLHGYPTSSVMFKGIMTALSDRYHMVAPDYPGFGFSAFPDRKSFEYTFRNIAAHVNSFTDAIGLTSFTLYVHDYGCPIGLRLCVDHPEKINGIVIQNGNAYDEGIGSQWDETKDYWKNPTPEKKKKVAAFLSKEGIDAEYFEGLSEEARSTISPELPLLDWELMKRPGNIDMQFELNRDYEHNIAMFPTFQAYFRKHLPPALILWGNHDMYFNVEEAACYNRDLPHAQVHVLEGGHMVHETNFDEVLLVVSSFLQSH